MRAVRDGIPMASQSNGGPSCRWLARVAILLVVCGLVVGLVCRRCTLPRDLEQKALGGQLRIDPRHLRLSQEKPRGVCGTRRLWHYDHGVGPGFSVMAVDSRVWYILFHERLPRPRVGGQWLPPLAVAGAAAWTGSQREVPSSQTAQPLTSEARDQAFLTLGAVLGLVVTDATGRKLYPALDWTGVPPEYPMGHHHVEVSFRFRDPPPGVPRQAKCHLVLDTQQADSVVTWDW